MSEKSLYPLAPPLPHTSWSVVRNVRRRIFVVKLARMYTTNAINIQRVGRGHIARRGKVRDVLEANHASRVITKALRTYIRIKVRERVPTSDKP